MHSPRFSKFCLVLAAVAAGWAQAGEGHGPPRKESGKIVVADAGISLDQAVSLVERRFKARVVRTEVRNEGDRKVYVLRLLNDAGRVWTVRVDAATGSIS
jgi:uncharacterized membrane protein YkoI